MKKAECEKLIKELVSRVSRTIEKDAIALFDSDRVNPGLFDSGDYLLPKMLVTAALQRNAGAFSPLPNMWVELVIVSNLVSEPPTQ